MNSNIQPLSATPDNSPEEEKDPFDVRGILKDAGYNPVEAMVEIAKEALRQEVPDYELAFKVNKELMKYSAPAAKARDVREAGSRNITFLLKDFGDLSAYYKQSEEKEKENLADVFDTTAEELNANEL